MIQALTKKAKINAEKLRISQLTEEHNAYFKLIISHQIDKKYNFHSVCSRKGSQLKPNELIKIYRALGKFIDESVKLTITDVEKQYCRPTDVHQGTYDPESDDDVQVEHYCLFKKGDKPDKLTDGIRLHGYSRTKGGYFVVTKFDWFHGVNK